MAYIIETPNPFQPLTDIRQSVVEAGISIRDWLLKRDPNFVEFEQPTICILNGKPLLRDAWDYQIQDDDVINFVAVPAAPIAFIAIAVALAVASIAVTLAFGVPDPGTPGATPESDPVFSVKGQSNSIRLGEPIEVCYGKNRIYPSYASRPYYQYIDNDQFQYSLFCVGQGYFDVEAVQIGDSLIEDYEEAEYQLVDPGGLVNLFPTNVYTSVEAGGQTLYAPNEEDYPTAEDGWVGPFVASNASTDSTYIEVDVVFPKGLYVSTDEGGISGQTVQFQLQAREIDDGGTPIGIWFDVTGGTETVSATTTTPQRRTIGAAVSAARYQVRMRRTNTRGIGHRYGNEIVWEGLKSYISDTQTFDDVTILAVKIRATSNLNDRTQQRFNVIATRKLAAYQSDGFLALEATRSPIWAFVDIFRSTYGANVTDADFFDWDALWELENTLISRGEYFDWVFRDPITVWEAARVVARAVRSVPLIVGSLISIKRDGPLTTPVAMFTADNIIEGSLTWDIKLWDLDEFDSIRAEYTDPNTGYKQETVLATLPFGTTNRPRDVRFPGIADRNHAYHEALYMLAVDRYLRENISFETGMEGYIPTFGDLIVVAHDVPNWSQSGYVVRAESESNGDFHIWTSEPLTFTEGESHVVLLRKKNGDVLGPYAVFQTTSPQQIKFNAPVDIDFLEDGDTEPMIFMFGISGQVSKYCRVVKMEPQGGQRIRITAVNEDDTIHSFDSLEAPALEDNDTVPQLPELPTVVNVQITQLNSTVLEVQISWDAAFGAEYYIVQLSEDGTNYTQLAQTERTSIITTVIPGTLYARVAAVNYGQGPWAYDSAAISTLAGLDLAIPFTVDNWKITWLEVLNAESYTINVYDNTSPSTPVLKTTDSVLKTAVREFAYLFADMVADGMEARAQLVEVTPVFNDGDGTPVELEITNAIPSPPTGVGFSFVGLDSNGDYEYNIYWTVPAEEDLIGWKVWVEPTSGFDPDVETPQIDDENSAMGSAGIPTSVNVIIPADSAGERPPYFIRVGLYDFWGNENSTNVQDEIEIPESSGWAP